MSIASEIQRIKDNVSEAYDSARKKKAILPAKKNSENLANTINSIPQFGDYITARFYDYDGILLYEMNKPTVDKLTELPTPPTHEGLITQGWNWTLEEIKESLGNNETVDVGCYFITDNGNTRFYINITDDDDLSVAFYHSYIGNNINRLPEGSIVVNWGDETSSGTPNTYDGAYQEVTGNIVYRYKYEHLYTSKGKYIIEINNPENIRILFGYTCSSGLSGILYAVELGSNINIEQTYFYNHKELETITVPNNISISQPVFKGCCRLRCITLRNNSFSGGYWTAESDKHFSNCLSLRAICTSKSALVIDSIPAGFAQNTGLTRYNNLARTKSIGGLAFSNSRMKGIINLTQCQTIGNGAFASDINIEQVLGFDYNTVIDREAFSGCCNLKYFPFVVISSTIGKKAFQRCSFINSVYINSSVNESAFYNCGAKSLVISKNNPNKSFSRYAFTDMDNLQWVDLTEFDVDDEIPVLSYPFYSIFTVTNQYEDNVKFYVKSDEVKAIFLSATNWADAEEYFVVGVPPETYSSEQIEFKSKHYMSLQSKTINNIEPNQEIYPDDGFDGLNKVVIQIPDKSLLSRKQVNFYDYDGSLLYSYSLSEIQGLTELPNLPYHKGLIAQNWNCDSLAQIKSAVNSGYIVDIGATYATADGSTRLYLYVPKGTCIPSLQIWVNMAAETSATVDWGDGTTSTITNNDSSVAAVYAEKTDYTEVNEDTILCVRIVGGSFTLGKGGDYTVFGTNCTSVGEYALQPSLIKVELGNNCTGLESNAFAEIRDLYNIVIPNNVTNLSERAFYNCTSLEAVVIPKTTESIGDNLFSGCAHLKTALLPLIITNALKSAWGIQTFINCYGLQNAMLPINISIIPTGTFRNCRVLASTIIPSSLTRIENYAFAYLRRLYSVDLTNYTDPTNLPELANTVAFSSMPAYTKFIVANQEMLNAFTSATNWAAYASRFKIKEA